MAGAGTDKAGDDATMTVLETERLRLREMREDDAPFILELVNDPDWIANIGDRGIRTPEEARAYVRNGPAAMYARHGFGLWLVEVKETGEPAGMCGLIKRDTLDDVDIGYAFLPAFRGRGYAREAAAATLRHGREALGMGRIVAIVSPGNADSIRLLEALGFRSEGMIKMKPDDTGTCLYANP